MWKIPSEMVLAGRLDYLNSQDQLQDAERRVELTRICSVPGWT